MTEPTGTGTPKPSGDPSPPRAWLSRNLVVLSAVSFLQDTASELVYPILPIFITVVLGAPAAVLGSIEGLADGISAIVSPFAGRAADRMGRKPLITAGYGLGALGKLLIALATAWPTVLVARCADRFGKGLRGSPRDALIADGVVPAQRGKAFGFHRAMDTFGAVIGPLIGLIAYEALDHQIRPLLWIAVIPAVLSVALVALVHDPRRDRVKLQYREAARASFRPDRSGHPRTAPTGVPACGCRAHRLQPGELPRRAVVAPAALDRVLRGHDDPGVCDLQHRVRDVQLPGRSTERPALAIAVYAVGLAFFSLGYIGLGLTQNTALAWVILCAYGMFAACTDGVGKAWASSLVGPALQGRAQGIYQGFTGMAIVIAGVWAGFAWHGTGVVPLLISGMVAGLFALWLWVAPPERLRADAAFTHSQ